MHACQINPPDLYTTDTHAAVLALAVRIGLDFIDTSGSSDWFGYINDRFVRVSDGREVYRQIRREGGKVRTVIGDCWLVSIDGFATVIVDMLDGRHAVVCEVL